MEVKCEIEIKKLESLKEMLKQIFSFILIELLKLG